MKDRSIDVNQLVHRIKKMKFGRKKKRGDNDQRISSMPSNSQLEVEDFLIYEGDEFIDCAYKIILGRDPDTEGLKHFKPKLKSGSLNRVEILNELRFSPEGQMRGINIKGLVPTREQQEIENIYNDSSFDSQKEFFNRKDFFKYDDEEFILRAYQGILKRVPDKQGIQIHLSSLRNNEKSKEEILQELRYSEEGQARQVRIVDLLPKIQKLEPSSHKKISSLKKKDEEYHIEDLMALPEKSFITKIFFLTRGYYPGEEELDPYLHFLTEKKKTKLAILKELQQTASGALPQLKIRGLGLYRVRHWIKKIPVLGILGNYLLRIGTFPGIISRLQQKVTSSLNVNESEWEAIFRENQQIQAKMNEILDWHRGVNERIASLSRLLVLDALVKDQQGQISLIKKLLSSKADAAELDLTFQKLEEQQEELAKQVNALTNEAGRNTTRDRDIPVPANIPIGKR